MLSTCGDGEDSQKCPLDCKEFKPVNKGNQPWVFTVRTGAKAKARISWTHAVNNLAAMSQFIGKDPDAGKDWGQEEKGMTEDEVVGWHHWFNGHEFEQTPGDSDRQESLVCCSSWGHRVGYDLVTEQQQEERNLACVYSFHYEGITCS